MVLPITKFDIKFVKKTIGNMHEKRLAERFSIDDRNDVDIILNRIRKDARGRYMYNRSDAMELLIYFRRYIDPDVPDNIFGCGGCATKIITQMFKIQKEWLNPTP